MYYFNYRILIQEDNKRIILLQTKKRNTLFFVMKVKHSFFIWKNSDKVTTVPEQTDFDLKKLKT
ncbi:hypothetical protein DW155_05865 [Lactococcus petauri]|nr:hypothetical protein DW155_05865 [Lactococcus petauri]